MAYVHCKKFLAGCKCKREDPQDGVVFACKPFLLLMKKWRQAFWCGSKRWRIWKARKWPLIFTKGIPCFLLSFLHLPLFLDRYFCYYFLYSLMLFVIDCILLTTTRYMKNGVDIVKLIKGMMMFLGIWWTPS